MRQPEDSHGGSCNVFTCDFLSRWLPEEWVEGWTGAPLLTAPPHPDLQNPISKAGRVLTTIISVGMGKWILCMYRALSSFTSTRKTALTRAKMSEAMLVWGRFLQISMKV